jgi:ribonuclease HI
VARKPSKSPNQPARALGIVLLQLTQARWWWCRSTFHQPERRTSQVRVQILFEVSNNEAEYEALLHGLRLAVSLGIKRLLFYGDSLLVVQQVNKKWDINKDTMDAYVMEIRKLEKKFSGL